jgi:predicted nucleic acid-binding protein
MRSFVDSSYWIALELSDDQNHKAAQKHWNSLDHAVTSIVTTSYVFDETITFLNSRNAHRTAVSLGESILLSPRIELVHVDEDLFLDGWKSFQAFDDKRFSLTDCISFLVMRKYEITNALTFDNHFVQAGFETLPSMGG